MPRVHVQKAGKDYPALDIKKGDTYYWWKFRYGGKRMSKTPPKPSELTQSKMSGVYAALEAMQETVDVATCPDDVSDALTECADEIRSVAEEYRDAVQNMPESLQQGSVAEECEDKASQLDDFAQEIEDAASEVDGMDVSDYINEAARREDVETEVEDAREETDDDDTIDNKIEAALAAQIELIKDFDDLDAGEQQAMLEDARSHASDLSCPL